MKYITARFTIGMVVCLMGAALGAHQVTYKGTVVAVRATSVTVTVIDEKTKKPAALTFKLEKDTKILRGETLVTFAEAKILKDEKIAVTVNHDIDEDLALVVRLDAKK